MNDRIPLDVNELMRERSARRETEALLKAERAAHADTKRVVVGMMGAIDAHLAQLREAIERR